MLLNQKTKIIDTNVLLRFLINDHPTLHQKAETILAAAEAGEYQIYINEMVIAELTWVLKSFYNQDKSTISHSLSLLTNQPWIVNPKKNMILKALQLFQDKPLSFLDSWLLLQAKQNRVDLLTFDQYLSKAAQHES